MQVDRDYRCCQKMKKWHQNVKNKRMKYLSDKFHWTGDCLFKCLMLHFTPLFSIYVAVNF